MMGIWSLLPVVVAVGLALWTKRALLSLLCGLLSAALLLNLDSPLSAFVYVVDPLLLDSVASRDNAKVVFFSLLVSGTVELMRVGGGTAALVSRFARFAQSRRQALVGTWLAGLTVFFDDYANCLIVGSSMRPVSDRAGISREKLAYLVDSTAAPVATLALVSTWIGYEVSLIDKALVQAGESINAYAFFLEGLPYRFYPILALVFGFFIAVSGRDFGPMLEAERAASKIPREDSLGESKPSQIWVAVIPLLLLIGVTGADLYFQGSSNAPNARRLFEIIGAADGYDAMLKGAISSSLSAVVLARMTGTSAQEIREGLAIGFGRIFEAIAILVCAWGIGDAIGKLGAADYLVQALQGSLPPEWMPAAVFVLAAAISFATGTSFGTMGTLMPLALPLALKTGADPQIVVAVGAAVLSGATWGDHCSPISDTTVLSSAGTECDHAAHVRTQLPYAMTVGVLSLVVCSIPIGFGMHWSIALLLGCAGCAGAVWGLGKKPEP
jgi:Na+/H+ antiporter NhaC